MGNRKQLRNPTEWTQILKIPGPLGYNVFLPEDWWSGVRFIELTCPGGNGDRWDQHGGLVDGHGKNCKSVDQPIAGLIRDLRKLGMLDETLVVWSGEFGRTPFAQGTNGRDHNPFGFTTWFAEAELNPEFLLELLTNLVTKQWKINMKSMIYMRLCSICLELSIPKVHFDLVVGI